MVASSPTVKVPPSFVIEVDENYLSAKSEEESSFKIYLLLNHLFLVQVNLLMHELLNQFF